jgi:outer membrane protein
MINLGLSRPAFLLFALAVSTPSFAQDPDRPSVTDGDFLTVGVGAAYGPSYDGSDDYIVSAIGAVLGHVHGVGISPRTAGLALDFIDDPKDAKISFQFGPVGKLRFDRNSRIQDPVVAALGKRNVAVEVGGNAGFSINRITNSYDSLTFSTDVRWDVGKAHRGMVIAPTVSYLTPVSKGSLVGFTLSAEHVDDKFAHYYYDVPAGSPSGLAAYSAREGWKSVGGLLVSAIDLDGNLANGGFALLVGGGYSKMLGNFKRSPIVEGRGKPDQWTGAVGIAYTF